MAEELEQFLSCIAPEELTFRAAPHFSKTGDCIIFYFDEASTYADRVDGIVTVYRAIEDDRLIGCQIKGVSLLVRKLGPFKIDIQDGDVHLSVLLLLSNLMADDVEYDRPRRRKLYEDLITRAGNERLRLPEDELELVGKN